MSFDKYLVLHTFATNKKNRLKILKSKASLAESIKEIRKRKKTIGFVPTMGALHDGHLSLIKIAATYADYVICSIFVNPTQFNDAIDLERYPRTIDRDVSLLEETSCQIIFLPEVEEMYPENENWSFNLGYLESILEGKFRKGHYQGVTQIVKKLLDAVSPDYLFLGQKDFQQVKVIQYMINQLKIPVRSIMCPIVRDPDGLALSSRNARLSALERTRALALSRVLLQTKQNYPLRTIDALKEEAWQMLNQAEGLIPEYFEICNAETLLPAINLDSPGIVALLAAHVGEVRLIDNIILK